MVEGIELRSRLRGSIHITENNTSSIECSIKSGIEKLGFRIDDVHIILNGKALCLNEIIEMIPTNSECILYLIHKCKTTSMVNFRIANPSSSKNQLVSIRSSCTVADLKDELVRLELNRKLPASSMKLITKGIKLDSKEVLGEYTGSNGSKPFPLMVMSDADSQLGENNKEVSVKVELPNKRSVSFDIRPNTPIEGVKVLLHNHFNAPQPHTFELYSSLTRQPLMNKVDDQVDSRLKQTILTTLTIADVILSIPKSSASKLSLFLLPACAMNINGVDLFVSSIQMLDRVFPVVKKTAATNKNTLADTLAAPSVPKLVAVPSAPRPSRPAAHPKEKKSKSRKGFAGLKRGFFTPEKKKKSKPVMVVNEEEDSREGTSKPSVKIALNFDDQMFLNSSPQSVCLSADSKHQRVNKKKEGSTSVSRSRRNKCQVCNKRLLAWDMAAGECRCGGVFCSRHTHFTAHDCAFDFATLEKEQLRSRSALPLSNQNFDHI